MGHVHGNPKEVYVEEMAVGSSQGSEDNQDAIEEEEKIESQMFKKPIPKSHHKLTLGRLKFRAVDDDDPSDWWFASTAIPLIAATFAPMANLLSIAALVVSWRNNINPDDPPALQQWNSPLNERIPDPNWCIDLNIASLVCGFLGNLFLLFNFTKRVRYIVALPTTIIFFFIASGILIGITAGMHIYAPPQEDQVYSQGYWHGVIAAVLYLLNSFILMANMLGYLLGHYPQHFTLTDEQRNLILQTMMFFIWLGAGAAVFAQVEPFSYSDALYFCDVTILTIGFGDYVATTDTGRGLVFPYSVGGGIILGLMVSSIHRFAKELSKDNVVRKHVESRRVNTLSRVVTTTDEEMGLGDERNRLEKEFSLSGGQHLPISAPLPDPIIQERLDAKARGERQVGFMEQDHPRRQDTTSGSSPQQLRRQDTMTSMSSFTPGQLVRTNTSTSTFQRTMQQMKDPVSTIRKVMSRSQKAIVMREEKDRFDAMRNIQQNARSFKKWYALFVSVLAFALLWCVGAVAFFYAEADTQGLSYFQSLYFCYVSLLTIGYGDLSPRSNAGKPIFIVWSLIAVPMMTILISDMGDTIIASFKRGTFRLADFTVLPKAGLYREFVERHPWLFKWLSRRTEKIRRKKGLQVGPENTLSAPDHTVRRGAQTIEQLALENFTDAQMTRRLAFAIRRVADDLVKAPGKHYTYEQWVEFTRLIRFSRFGDAEKVELDEEMEGVVDWDWLDENSPMLSEQSESEWVLDRLCESLLRMLKKGLLAGSGESMDEELNHQLGDFHFDGTSPELRTHSVGAASEARSARRRSAATRDSDDENEAPVHMDEPAEDNSDEISEDEMTRGPGTQDRRRRGSAAGTAANAILDFFTGERRGTHAYANEAPQWSRKAMEKREAQQKKRQEQLVAAAAAGGEKAAATSMFGPASPTGPAVRRGPFRKLDMRPSRIGPGGVDGLGVVGTTAPSAVVRRKSGAGVAGAGSPQDTKTQQTEK